MPRKPVGPFDVLKGSGLEGADEDLASWCGLDVPDDKWDAYVDTVGGVTSLAEFFESISNGYFEVTEQEDASGPGLNDTYWVISADDPEALRAEVRARLVSELGLVPNPEEPS